MIPLRDVIPSNRTPAVTVGLIAVNAAAWFYELSLEPDSVRAFLDTHGVVPSNLRVRTIVSAMFLHGSWSHVIGNLWFLWIFGDNVEDRMGRGRFLAFYLLCGAGATLGHVMLDPASTLPMIGASGAIAGVMGAYVTLYPRSRVLALVPLIIVWDIVEVPAVLLLGFWFVLQLLSAGPIAASTGVGGGVAFAAHVGGFLLGVATVLATRTRERHSRW